MGEEEMKLWVEEMKLKLLMGLTEVRVGQQLHLQLHFARSDLRN
jgi:hypothetical protein